MNHYTYMIVLKQPSDQRKYYIGARSCKVKPDDDVGYFSSCEPLKEWIKQNGASHVEKMILAPWPSREDALEHEKLLHQWFDVDKNSTYWNRAKQTSSKFFYDFTGVNRGPLSESHKVSISKTKTGVKNCGHKPETILKQKGVEYHCPKTFKTVRVKVHLGEKPLDGWVKGRFLKRKRSWITNGLDSKLMYVDSHLPKGWCFGRSANRNEKGQFK